MKKLILCLLLVGCASSNKNSDSYSNEISTINLPRSKGQDIVRSPFFNTQKSYLGEKRRIKYNFYYGSGGRYLLSLTPAQDFFVDFSKVEVTILVDKNGKDPETISLATSPDGIFPGIGATRKGITNYTIQVYIPSSRYNSSIEENFSFNVNIEDF